jgi:death-on-curing protein
VAKRREPRWLTRLVVDAVHTDQLREHGGRAGVRDENALEAALARPSQRWHYKKDSTLEELAAAYACGLVTHHPYHDGNKRIGFLALVTFLGINGLDFDAPEEDVVTAMIKSASGMMSEDQLTEWNRAHTDRAK